MSVSVEDMLFIGWIMRLETKEPIRNARMVHRDIMKKPEYSIHILGQVIIHADGQQNPPLCVLYIGIIGDIALSTYLILKISLRIFNKINALVIFYIVLAFGSRCDKIIPAFLRRSGAYDLLPAIQKVEGGIIPELSPFPDAFVEIQIDFHEGITESLPLFINSCNSHKGFVALTVNQDI